MNYVRDRAEAIWLPSRYHFALSRLVALAMLHIARPSLPPVDHLAYAIDRHQSALENYAVSIWFVATATCYVAALLPLAPAAAIGAGFALTLTSIQVFIPLSGRVVGSRKANSFVLMLCLAAASLYFASRLTWARVPAMFFLGVIALNALAAAVLWLLRHRVREVEQRCAA